MSSLTQKQLKVHLHYDPDTGRFTRIGVGIVRNLSGKSGYIPIRVAGRQYDAHRLAVLYMMGKFPPHDVDHVDHNKRNTRWDNLRVVTRIENSRNVSLHSRNTSGVCGVSPSGYNTWRVCISLSPAVRLSLGSFKEWWDAVCVRKSAENRYGYHPNHGGVYV